MQRLTVIGLVPKLALFSAIAVGVGCAGVKQQTPTGGAGSSGIGGSGGNVAPPIPGLTALMVSPKTATVTLGPDPAIQGQLVGTTQLTATGTVNGSSQDVTSQVGWSSNFPTGTVSAGLVTLTAPGTYTITAASGSYSDTATVTAAFTGDIMGAGFDSSKKATLDGSTSGSASIAYPIDHSLFPSNLSPIYAQISPAGQTARLNFQTDGLNVNFYGNCVTSSDSGDAFPAGGCYVKMPLSLTRLFIAASANNDIQMTARVSGGGAPSESASVNVAWANVALSGGLYYWSTLPGIARCPSATDGNPIPNPPTYCMLDNPATTSAGTAIFRYAFTTDGSDPAPQQIWTDDGGPGSSPAYSGAPQSWVSGNAGAHCIGCHSITSDGKYMALTLGGSSGMNGANFSLLDIGSQQLYVVDPTKAGGNNCMDANATTMSDPACYWQSYRKQMFATETAWGPPASSLMVSMYESKLYTSQLSISGTSATTTRMGQTFPTSNTEYQSDPFWSFDGKYVVFTSFPAADVGNYNTDGLNGDMKKNGKICIADASNSGVMDNARDLVGRIGGATLYYPSINSDSSLVVFNRSTCGSDPDPIKSSTDYGNQSCDGYDDSTAQLWLVPIGGGTPKSLDRANGAVNGNTPAYDNSWPRWSPDKGTFRGQDLHWVAYSSRRPYGMQLNTGAANTTKPQLWIAGVTSGQEFGATDPSFAPVWLPAQNPKQTAANGNHVPQWVKVAVIIN